MATQDVCRYNKFGFCKFKEECRIPHVNEVCDNSLCDIKNCVKRHPRKCKFYRYNRCKFKENCSFSHENQIDSEDTFSKKFEQLEKDLKEANEEIEKNKICNDKLGQLETKIERFLVLEKAICEKDVIIDDLLKKMQNIEKHVEEQLAKKDEEIKNLLEKVQCLESKVIDLEENTIEKANDESKIDEPQNLLECTFVNPSSVYTCNLCEFIAKNESDLNTHNQANHEEKELRFQLYARVVSTDFNAMEVRKNIIENLNKQEAIEKVLTVFVDGRGSNPAIYDTDNNFLIEADIKFSSKSAKLFQNSIKRDKIFENGHLSYTKPFRGGRITREDFLRFRNETQWRMYY